MISQTTLRRELLRLAGASRHPVCISTKRISAFYSVPEKSVRRELAKLADDHLIRVSGWDGREMRPYSSWRSADEFVESSLGDGHLHVDVPTPE